MHIEWSLQIQLSWWNPREIDRLANPLKGWILTLYSHSVLASWDLLTLYWQVNRCYICTLYRWLSVKTAVSPLLAHWRYCSLSLSHRYHPFVGDIAQVAKMLVPLWFCADNRGQGICSHDINPVEWSLVQGCTITKNRWGQDGRHFADNILQCLLINIFSFLYLLHFHWFFFLGIYLTISLHCCG